MESVTAEHWGPTSRPVDFPEVPRGDSRPLSRGQVRRFREQGFLVVPNFARPSEVAELRPVYDQLFSRRAGLPDGNYFDFGSAETGAKPYSLPQLLHLSRYAPELLQSRIVELGWQIARQILGKSARLIVDHGMVKPVGSKASTPWHQDEAFWHEGYDHDALSIWIPLQAVDEHNGCMQFAPGSHRGRLLAHQPISKDPLTRGLEVQGLQPAQVVKCRLDVGGATIHHARTLHYSAPNSSSAARRAYILIFHGRVRRRLFPRVHHWKRRISETVSG